MEMRRDINEALIRMALNGRISLDGRVGAVRKILDRAIRSDEQEAAHALLYLAVLRYDSDAETQRVAEEAVRCLRYVRSESLELSDEASKMLHSIRRLK